MSSKIEISRELAERIVKTCMFTMLKDDYEELRALLAAPVVERQEPVLFVAVESIEDPECVGMHATRHANELQHVPLFTSPPAPVAVIATAVALVNSVEPVTEAYILTGHSGAAETGELDSGLFAELIRAVRGIDKVKELNQ